LRAWRDKIRKLISFRRPPAKERRYAKYAKLWLESPIFPLRALRFFARLARENSKIDFFRRPLAKERRYAKYAKLWLESLYFPFAGFAILCALGEGKFENWFLLEDLSQRHEDTQSSPSCDLQALYSLCGLCDSLRAWRDKIRKFPSRFLAR